jgi:hypothetical protein
MVLDGTIEIVRHCHFEIDLRSFGLCPGWQSRKSMSSICSTRSNLRYWEDKIKHYNIAVNEIDNDQLVKSRTWTKKFEVLDFETTRDDALDLWGTWTCYTDGSKLGNHSGYGYLINKFGRTIYEGFDHISQWGK